MGAEQSNSSIVFDERLVLKAYRRLEAGPNPELEILRFLTERDFPHIAAAARAGTSHSGRLDRRDARHRPGLPAPARRDGWDLALADLREDRGEAVAGRRSRELGGSPARLHTALGSDSSATPPSRPRSPAPRRSGC